MISSKFLALSTCVLYGIFMAMEPQPDSNLSAIKESDTEIPENDLSCSNEPDSLSLDPDLNVPVPKCLSQLCPEHDIPLELWEKIRDELPFSTALCLGNTCSTLRKLPPILPPPDEVKDYKVYPEWQADRSSFVEMGKADLEKFIDGKFYPSALANSWFCSYRICNSHPKFIPQMKICLMEAIENLWYLRVSYLLSLLANSGEACSEDFMGMIELVGDLFIKSVLEFPSAWAHFRFKEGPGFRIIIRKFKSFVNSTANVLDIEREICYQYLEMSTVGTSYYSNIFPDY